MFFFSEMSIGSLFIKQFSLEDFKHHNTKLLDGEPVETLTVAITIRNAVTLLLGKMPSDFKEKQR